MRILELSQMADEMVRLQTAELVEMERGLERVAKLVEATAKSEFGEYQPGVGSFPPWAPLTPETQDERVRLGYTANDPLLRSGDTQDSIQHETHGLETFIGSTSETMLYLEAGTSKMPPRPVLGPAAIRNEQAIKDAIAEAVVAGFIGGEMAFNALGYGYGAVKKL